METLHIRRQLIIDKHLNSIDYSTGSELNSAFISAMEEYAELVKNLGDIGDVIECECEGVQDLIALSGECRKCGGQCTY